MSGDEFPVETNGEDFARQMRDWHPVLTVPNEDDDDPLTIEQQQRTSALYHARQVLERRGGGPLVPVGASSPPPVSELIRVARWIIEGNGL